MLRLLLITLIIVAPLGRPCAALPAGDQDSSQHCCGGECCCVAAGRSCNCGGMPPSDEQPAPAPTPALDRQLLGFLLPAIEPMPALERERSRAAGPDRAAAVLPLETCRRLALLCLWTI